MLGVLEYYYVLEIANKKIPKIIETGEELLLLGSNNASTTGNALEHECSPEV